MDWTHHLSRTAGGSGLGAPGRTPPHRVRPAFSLVQGQRVLDRKSNCQPLTERRGNLSSARKHQQLKKSEQMSKKGAKLWTIHPNLIHKQATHTHTHTLPPWSGRSPRQANPSVCSLWNFRAIRDWAKAKPSWGPVRFPLLPPLLLLLPAQALHSCLHMTACCSSSGVLVAPCLLFLPDLPCNATASLLAPPLQFLQEKAP